MKAYGSLESVVAAINDELQVEVERLERETVEQVSRLQQAPAQPIALPDCERRLAVAHASAREQAAIEDYRDAEADLQLREAWIGRVAKEGQQRLVTTPPRQRLATLARLVDEALRAIPSDECTVLLNADDARLVDEPWRKARAITTGKSQITIVASDIEFGCVAQSQDGRVQFDNSLDARIARAETALRTAMATIFEDARR